MINPKQMGGKAISFLLLLIALLISACITAPPQPPNIVWIVLEDMSPQFFGAYGNEAARTPLIDSLINAGTRFDAAFSTGAVCSPSRYTLITGTRTNGYGTGHHRSSYPIPETVKSKSLVRLTHFFSLIAISWPCSLICV